MTTVAERVAKGAALLDEKDPGWWREDVDRAIDLAILALGSARFCVLGQRCPLEYGTANFPYWDQALTLTGTDPADQSEETEDRVHLWAVEHGFTAAKVQPEGSTEWDDLTEEWTRVIGGRRAGP